MCDNEIKRRDIVYNDMLPWKPFLGEQSALLIFSAIFPSSASSNSLTSPFHDLGYMLTEREGGGGEVCVSVCARDVTGVQFYTYTQYIILKLSRVKYSC